MYDIDPLNAFKIGCCCGCWLQLIAKNKNGIKYFMMFIFDKGSKNMNYCCIFVAVLMLMIFSIINKALAKVYRKYHIFGAVFKIL